MVPHAAGLSSHERNENDETNPNNPPPSTTHRGRLGREDAGVYLLQSTIIAISCLVLSLGLSGAVQVSDRKFPLNESGVAFAIGIAVQVALIATLELARRISQAWLWERLAHSGDSLRSVMTTWSVIYSNSYRGAEDVFKGIGPISAFLMVVYLMEVVVLGAIGSLYFTEAVVTLKGTGSLPMYRPVQSAAIHAEEAYPSTDCASTAFFNFAKIYDPTAVQGTDPGGACEPLFKPNASGAVLACESVLTHPLTVPVSTTEGETISSPVTWTTLEKGDFLNSRSTEIFTTVSCEASDRLSITQPATAYDQMFLMYNSTEGVVSQATKPLWAVFFSLLSTPQIQVIIFGGGLTGEDPVIDESGAMVFAMLAFNFDAYPGWTELTFNTFDASSLYTVGTRQVGLALCRAAVALGTTQANYTILQTDPSLVVKLNSAVRDPGEPVLYSMDPEVNVWGYSVGIFLLVASTQPPKFDLTIGLVKATTLTNGLVAYTADLETVAQGMSRMIARILPSFTSAVDNATGLDSLLVSTSAEVWEKTSTRRIYTSPACNWILGVGIACAVALILLHLAQTVGRIGSPIWTTRSVYLLLQALPSVRGGEDMLRNLSRSKWKDASLEILKDAASRVTVRGAIDTGGNITLDMTGKDGCSLEREAAAGMEMGKSGKWDVEAVPSAPVSVGVAHLGSDET
ncbi:hypothetical protein HDU87_008640 [Geranomyces variabilis]|uniref:Uncharacterized protein n=1 Tax=Geranomyces variabilis TaxID=109894 RepID=A0AAD5XM25_9FUNG|nr:hypothetical protein HDU87_008640 [Geranomyces variabilis]